MTDSESETAKPAFRPEDADYFAEYQWQLSGRFIQRGPGLYLVRAGRAGHPNRHKRQAKPQA